MDEDLTIAANGAQYRKDKRGFMPELIIKMYDERVRYKVAIITLQSQINY